VSPAAARQMDLAHNPLRRRGLAQERIQPQTESYGVSRCTSSRRHRNNQNIVA
jgi:hypothetical protein